jgi:hypothetical protein
MFDTTKNAKKELDYWLKTISQNVNNIEIFIIGNKIDLPEKIDDDKINKTINSLKKKYKNIKYYFPISVENDIDCVKPFRYAI